MKKENYKKKSLRKSLTSGYIKIFTIIFILMFLLYSVVYWVLEVRMVETEILEPVSILVLYENEFQNDRLYNLGSAALEKYKNNISIAGYYQFSGEQEDFVKISGNGEIDVNTVIESTLWTNIKSFISNGRILYKKIFITVDQSMIISFIDFNLFDYFLVYGSMVKYLSVMALFFIVYILGNITLRIFGNRRARNALKPIHDITVMADSINEKDLNLRIDTESAQYELKDLCITINNMLDRLQGAYNRQRSFVSDASHELRTPISIIDGYANMLKRWGKTDDTILNESIITISSETENMKNLVESLLFLARHDENNISFGMEDVDVSGMLADIARETMIIDKGMHEISDSVEEGIIIKGDIVKLKQCIRIFVDNALKYSPPAAGVRIAGIKENGVIKIVISDEGQGIAAKHLGHIFNRFYRADNSRSRETGGVGLGLPIARAIILGHSGKISIKTKEHQGTQVQLSFPVPI